jgi:uncharacterized protein (TIGR03086 family)
MSNHELVALFHGALDDFTDTVRGVSDEQWHTPTPCPDWDVYALVNHVVGEQLWMPPLFNGRTVAEVGDQFSGDVVKPEPVAVASRAAAEVKTTVAEPGALGRTVHLSFGDTSGEEYVRQLLADHLIHRWDLAVATGQDPTLNRAVTEAVADWFNDREEMYREGGFIGPRVPVPDDADPSFQLLSRFGRDPDWAP